MLSFLFAAPGPASTPAFAPGVPALETPITIQQLNELNFGEAPQGDAARTLTPESRSPMEVGIFQVQGPGNRVFSVILPSGPVYLQSAEPGVGASTIEIHSFRSVPPEGSSTALDPQGTRLVYIGATRAALSLQQRRGSYTGQYLITLIY
jgi:hypothetical protein